MFDLSAGLKQTIYTYIWESSSKYSLLTSDSQGVSGQPSIAVTPGQDSGNLFCGYDGAW